MSQTQTGTSHAIGVTPVATAAPAFLCGWYNVGAAAQGKQCLQLAKSTDVTNVFSLGHDRTSSGGKVSAFAENTSTNQNQALTTVAITTGVWQHYAAALISSSQVAVWLNGVNKGPHTTPAVPSGINETLLSGRASDFSFGIGGQFAHQAAAARVPNDVEIAYLGIGGSPRAIPLGRYWKGTSGQSPIVDEFGVENLTVTGFTAGTTDPSVSTWWTAAAQGNQTATQGGTFPAITLTTKFDQVAAAVDYTCTLLQIQSAGTALSANGAATTASNLLTINGTAPAVGSYVSIAGAARTLVLFVSGQTLLLATAQTWNNADTVTPYAVSAPTGLTTNGYTITSNTTGGTVGAGAVGTYANCLYRATNNSNAALFADSALHTITVAASGAAPSFSAGPTLTSATTDGYVFGATSTQTATWYAVALLRGSPSLVGNPTAVKTGSPTGFVSRFTTALTAATPGTLTYTGLTFPVYDLYHVVDNGSGTSAVAAFTSQLKSAGSTQQYVRATVRSITAITQANPAKVTSAAHGLSTGNTVEVYGVAGMTQVNGTFVKCTVVDANNLTLNGIDSTAFTAYSSGGSLSWGQSVDAGSSTAIATGDIRIIPLVTQPDGCFLTMQPDGSYSIAAGAVTRRQSFTIDCYDDSGQALIGSATEYMNSASPLAPQITGAVRPAIFLPANQVIVPVPLAGIATDPQGDTLTATASGLPASLSVVSSALTGSTSASTIVPATITWTNAAGETTSSIYNLAIGAVTPPNLAGMSQGDIEGLLDSLYLTPSFGQQDSLLTAGTAIAQNPTFGTPVPFGTIVSVTLSTGIAPSLNVSVPDVTSSPTDQGTAVMLLQAAGFIVEVPQPWLDVRRVTQVPAAFSAIASGSVVRLFLQAGNQPARARKGAPKAPYIPRGPLKRAKR